MGEIETYFFEKLRTELGLNEIGIGHAMYDVLDIPSDSFSVNDEAVGNCDGVLKYVFSEYTKLPIKELNDKSLQDLGIAIEFCKGLKTIKMSYCSVIMWNKTDYPISQKMFCGKT